LIVVQTDSNTHSSSFRSVSVNAVLGDLREGLEQNIGLVLAKAVLGLIGTGVDYRALVRDAVLLGARNRYGWGIGLTLFGATENGGDHCCPDLRGRDRSCET
jgi:hypothetical protein